MESLSSKLAALSFNEGFLPGMNFLMKNTNELWKLWHNWHHLKYVELETGSSCTVHMFRQLSLYYFNTEENL